MPARTSSAKQRAKTDLASEVLSSSVHQKTRAAHLTELTEDYVEVIADLIEASGEARATDIARRLGVTHVTVTRKIARMARDGLVSTRPYRSIFLTPAGQKIAAQSREKHQIVMNFLIALGVDKKTALTDSEGIEHHVSEKTLQAFKRFTAMRR